MACYRLIIHGRLPGLNEYIDAERRNRYLGAKVKSDAERAIRAEIAAQLRHVKIRQPVRMLYRWYESSRRRDKSNVCAYGRKVIEDALVGAGVLENDGWGEIDGFVDRFFVDGENPRVEVFLCTADAPGIESWSQIIAWEPPPKKPRRKHAPGKKDAGK